MKKLSFVPFSAILISLIALGISFGSLVPSSRQSAYDPRGFVPHEIIIKFKDYPTGDPQKNRGLIQNIINAVRGTVKTYQGWELDTSDWEPTIFAHRSFIGDPYLFHIKLPETGDIDETMSYLKSIPYIEYVEKNTYIHLDSTEPNDSRYPEQWALKNSASRGPYPWRSEINGFGFYVPYCDIHAPEAWDVSTGNPDVVVAVLDTGILSDHIDLAANIWTNPNDPEDGEDNDLNGFRDDIHGWDFVAQPNGDNDPEDYGIYHGTCVSGIIGAVGNNNEGISGVCWNVKLMPIKIVGGDLAAVVNGIDYATMNGAYVLNASWHYEEPDPEPLSIKSAIARAMKKNKLFVCAAGNYTGTGQDIDKRDAQGNLTHPCWPASWKLDNILAVLATIYEESSDKEYLEGESNFGATSVDIGAPGRLILTTYIDPLNYILFGKTSAATPHIAGVAALALGVSPGLTFSRIKSLIIQNDDNFSSLSGKCVSGGRVNAKKVLNALGGTTVPSPPSNLSASPTAWDTIQLAWKDNSNNELGFEIQRKDNYQANFIHDNCSDSNLTSYASMRDETIDPAMQRTYQYRLRATNRAGSSGFSNTVSASIPYTLPEAPADLQGQSPVVYQLVYIYWTDRAVNELYYIVERRISGYDQWEQIAILPKNSNSYNDSSAQAGTTYDYRVKAWNPLGDSGHSNSISIEVINW